MVDICEGNKTKHEVMDESIERYKEMFMKTKIEFQKLMDVRSVYRLDLHLANQTF